MWLGTLHGKHLEAQWDSVHGAQSGDLKHPAFAASTCKFLAPPQLTLGIVLVLREA